MSQNDIQQSGDGSLFAVLARSQEVLAKCYARILNSVNCHASVTGSRFGYCTKRFRTPATSLECIHIG